MTGDGNAHLARAAQLHRQYADALASAADSGTAAKTVTSTQEYFDNLRRMSRLPSAPDRQAFCIGSLTIERDGYKRLAESRRTDIARLVEEIKRVTFERDAALRLLAGREPEPEVNPVFSAIAVHQAQGVR